MGLLFTRSIFNLLSHLGCFYAPSGTPDLEAWYYPRRATLTSISAVLWLEGAQQRRVQQCHFPGLNDGRAECKVVSACEQSFQQSWI